MQKLMTCARLGLLAVLMASTHAVHAQANPDKWEMGVEAGYLKKIKHNSPFDYQIVPTQLVWRTPVALELWRGSNGASLTLRNRLAVVFESYVKGAENYYVGFAGSPVLELWSADRNTALFYELGGGSGWTNSQHVVGGQGQNFAFNWFTQFGLRRQIAPKTAITGGTYFVHHSNLGMTKPNPGIDVLGLNFGIVMQID